MKSLYFKIMCFFLMAYNLHSQGNDVIFLIDNSGSIDNVEYPDMNASIQNIITEVLACNENNRIAIAQYADVGSTSQVYIESDFTNIPMVFNRRFSTGGGANAHSAVTLLGNALDNVFNVNILGTTVLNQVSGNSLVVYLFTDDIRGGLVASPAPPVGSNSAFQAYTAFKTTRGATFVVTIVSPNALATQAAAAIASHDPSGLYVGSVESYPADPDGPGVTPRFLLDKSDFNLTATEIENITRNICSCSTLITGNRLGPLGCQWDDTADNYVFQAVANRNCKLPEGTLGGDLSTMAATITTSNNFVSNAEILVGNTKQFMWRVRTECGRWSEWCCHDGTWGGGPTIFSNGTCFYTDQPCEGDYYNILIDQDVLSGQNVEEQASNLITATNTINSGAQADYRAINEVYLQSGFHAQSGSLFIARIVECEAASSIARERKTAQASNAQEEYEMIRNINNKLRVIPNPSSSSTEVSLDDLKISAIIVSSLDGRTMFSRNENAYSYKIDVSNYDKGIYMITVMTENGEIITGKIVKN